MPNNLHLFAFFLVWTLFISCTSEEAHLTGSIDYVGSAEIYLEKQPLHYKYAEKRRYPVEPSQEGRFSLSIPVDSTIVAHLTITDEGSYPLVLKPGISVELEIPRAAFPDSISVQGFGQKWNQQYIEYRKRENRLLGSVEDQLEAFRDAEPNEVLNLYRERIMLAKRYLGDTPLDLYYHKAVGEYLVKRLENIKYRRNNSGFNPDRERKEVIIEAKQYNFFTFESLYDQRAGIRDFTNAYANTFGVEERLEEKYGQELMQYDIKRLGYKTMDSARVSVLRHIENRKARAYAEMHLIAERIGEMSPEVARPSYKQFISEYRDFPRYTSFLTSFFQRVQSVSPGEPAVPFTLPNPRGEMFSMSDFRGKYVLLDFWASWCIPCLDEFPHMRDLYRKYSREDFEIVAISIEEDSLKWRQALQRFDNPWVQLYGGEGFQQETFDAYQGGGIPFYILVDRKGGIERYNDIRPSFNLPGVLDSLLQSEE